MQVPVSPLQRVEQHSAPLVQRPPSGVHMDELGAQDPSTQLPLQQSMSAVQRPASATHVPPQRSTPIASRTHTPPQHSSPNAQVLPSLKQRVPPSAPASGGAGTNPKQRNTPATVGKQAS